MTTRLFTVLVFSLMMFPGVSIQAQETEFQETYQQLKDISAQMQALLQEAQASGGNQEALGKLREKFTPLQEQRQELLPRVRTAALAAYKAAPNQNADVTDVLIGLAEGETRNDQYATAAEITDLLLANNSEGESLHDIAGMVAFGMDDFDKAEQYFKMAEEKGQMRFGKAFLGKLENIKNRWVVEQEIRATEAAADDLPLVLMETSEGNVTIELYENQAPNTVANFVSLIEKGYYDGLTFHRVLPNFMAQGGCPNGTGGGGPGYNIPCECTRDDFRYHFSGTLSMAHAGKDSGGSQFFLTFIATPHLDGKHTAFGRVIDGKDVLGKLTKIDPGRRTDASPSKITRATVIRKRDHDYSPKKVGE